MKRAYFITATGTDLGKTWLAAGVASVCRSRGMPVRVVKPVMSGYDAANPAASDAYVLSGKAASDVTQADVEAISPWRFAAPLSPDLAAAREGRSIEFTRLVTWCRDEIARHEGLLLIEGIGGVMVPLDRSHTVREWIAALGIPTLLIAGTYLGALSHTLTALAALHAVGITPVALVLNESAENSVGLAATLASLAHHSGDVPLLTVRRDDVAGVMRLADFLLGSGQ